MLLHRRELTADPEADGRRKLRGHMSRRRPRVKSLAGADAQPLPALGTAALEHDAAILGPHPDEETMCAPSAAAVWLICALH
jgi:hypothetical protein